MPDAPPPAVPVPPALQVDHVTVTYGAIRALDDVSIDAPPATITAVLGANGAGKTTLVRAISGLVRPQRGSIRAGGKELSVMPVEAIAALGIGHVPEGGGVIGELTVEENLRLGGLLRADRVNRHDAEEEIYEMFPPLAPRRRRPATSLSGGERQMLAIGRALMAKPTILLLDEPSLGLAPIIVAQIMSLLQRLRDESGMAVLLVEQNARSALSVADKAVVLNLGKVVKTDDATAVAEDTGLRHAYLGF